MLIKTLTTLLTAALLCASPAFGQEVAPEEFRSEADKLFTNNPNPIGAGTLELVPGVFLFSGGRDFDNDGNSIPTGTFRQTQYFLAATYGVSENFDVNLTTFFGNAVDLDNDFDEDGVLGPFTGTGVGDLTLGTRHRFWQSDGGEFTLGWLNYLTIQTGSEASDGELGFTQGFTAINPRLVGSWQGGHVNAALDVGYIMPLGSNDAGARGGVSVNAALGYQPNDVVQPLVELNYLRQRFEGDLTTETLGVTGGVLIWPAEDVRFNMGVTKTVAGRNAVDGWGGIFSATFSLDP
jgi:hypothetical protein